jgi:small subunit ribosomal protein S3
MGQKVNPISFRIKVNKGWDSKWFSERPLNYSTILHENFEIKRYIKGIFKSYSFLISRCFIKRSGNQTNIIVHLYQFQKKNIILTDLNFVKKVTDVLERITKGKIRIHVINIKYLSIPKTIITVTQQLNNKHKNQKYFKESLIAINTAFAVKSAPLLSAFLARQIELNYRHSFFIDLIRKAIPLFLFYHPQIKGIKVQFKGRINGVDRSKKEYIQQGQISLHTLSANVDFGISEAFTPFGVCGVKVWICF